MNNKNNDLKKIYDSSKDGLSSESYSFEKNKGFCHEKNDTKAYGRFNGKTVIRSFEFKKRFSSSSKPSIATL